MAVGSIAATILVGAMCFFLFSHVQNLYVSIVPTYNILTCHVARSLFCIVLLSLSYSYNMYILFFDRLCFLGFAVVCDGGSRGNVGSREKYVVKLKEIK